ncbi:HNH endonuclease [Nocardia fluminea]
MREGGWTQAVGYRRRARLAKAVTESFRPIEIFERDSWECGICARPVERSRCAPDPLSASVDHIVPVSLGGDHTRANVRLAHLRCNIRRGNRVV